MVVPLCTPALWQLRLYRFASAALTPFVILHLLRRRLVGMERAILPRLGMPPGVRAARPAQQPRRSQFQAPQAWRLTFGAWRKASWQRPLGKRVVWLHGASAGESLSALTLASLLEARRAGAFHFVITCGTAGGIAVRCSRHLPPRA